MSEEKKIKGIELHIEEMAKAGLHFGHKTSKLYPKMRPFVFSKKGTIHIINLEKTKQGLADALNEIQKVVRKNGTILFVGTKVQHKDLIQELAAEFGFPYVKEKWIGGLLTNFETIKQRVAYFKEFRQKFSSSDFEKYTKKEQHSMEVELAKLEKKFGGIENMENLPDMIFISDIIKDKLALKEANKHNIPVVGVVDTNANPGLVDFPIPANDDAYSSMKYIADQIREAIKNIKE